MHRVEVQQYTLPADVHYVADHLRAEDKRELETATGRTAHEAVFASWATSDMTWVAHIDGQPGVIFGVGAGGVIWLVGTDAIGPAARPVLRMARPIVASLLNHYGRLHNRADIRNTTHLRWLRLLGFTFDDVIQINGQPFQRFHMTREEGPNV
jgi:hypothetical protein